MKGTKEFINHTGLPIKVLLYVRCGDRIGSTFRVHEFRLAPGERKCVDYGNECNPFLDGIRVISNTREGFTETALFVGCRGGFPDRLLNEHKEIKFLRSAFSIVITADFCRC